MLKPKWVKWLVILSLVVVLSLAAVLTASAVSGAAFTTFNPWVDGLFKDVCKNSLINCNIYGAKEYVWLNGGPAANGIGGNGDYFFAVLAPGGQPNPNDGTPKNLSDDYDFYTNRTFTITDGEVSAYGGTHWLDSGNFLDPTRAYCTTKGGCPADGEPPLIRLFPYADTPNPGGVYIMAICSLERGYPVSPRDCKYDAFKVKAVETAVLMLSGMKFEDIYADGVKDPTDPGLTGWDITIKGTGFLGEPIDEKVTTGAGGYWEFEKYYSYKNNTPLVDAVLEVCEVLKTGWYQSYPDPICYSLIIPPAGVAEVNDLDFGNWRPVTVTACKDELKPDSSIKFVVGWPVSLTEAGVVVDTQVTGEDGCYTWEDLKPGIVYDVHEGMLPGWYPMGDTDYVFDKAVSGGEYKYTFVNRWPQWCSPGYWRQEQHLGSWAATGISPTEFYNDYFDPDLAGNPTLWEVLQSPQIYGGGPFNNVGDLLSYWHPDVNFFVGERVEDSCPLGRDPGPLF